MKLYATITSERASKGQGGNEYLDIDITVRRSNGSDVYLSRLTVRPDETGIGLYTDTDNLVEHINEKDISIGKAKRQKGKFPSGAYTLVKDKATGETKKVDFLEKLMNL